MISCCCLFAKLCPTPCDPWTAVHQGPLSFTISWSVFKLMPIESVMLPNYLILSPPSPLALNLSQHHKILLKREITSSFASFMKDLLRKVPGNLMWWAHLDILLTPKSAGRWNPVGKTGLRASDVNQLFRTILLSLPDQMITFNKPETSLFPKGHTGFPSLSNSFMISLGSYILFPETIKSVQPVFLFLK